MRRISDEEGDLAGWRNWGRLCLSLIPAALGGAGVLWVTTVFGCIDLTRELRIERRTMQSVGISVLPRTPIALLVHDGACSKVDSSYMDGDLLQFYVKNTCKQWLQDPNFLYQLKAHDGTVIGGHQYAFDGPHQMAPQERREQGVRTDNDSRIESVELWLLK